VWRRRELGIAYVNGVAVVPRVLVPDTVVVATS
jgi:hypothetical protein